MIEKKELPMVSLIINRSGLELYRGIFGYSNIEDHVPLKDDTIFRIFSMTKVITVVAVMQLVEQGYICLSDPVEDFLPGFRNQSVAFTDNTGRWNFRPSISKNTIYTLLTMTSGIPYYHKGRNFVEDHMATLYESIDNSQTISTIEAANLIGQNPLAFDPANGFSYGLSIDVIAAIVEIVSGQKFSEYCKINIFDPLKMNDTGFFVPNEKIHRLSGIYTKNSNGDFESSITIKDQRQLNPPKFEEGGDGIVTTTRDYNKFVQMLSHGGAWENKQILSEASVYKISQNHLQGHILNQCENIVGKMEGPGYGYGLGVRVLINPASSNVLGGKGQWGWMGKGGSWFCIDPKYDITIVLNTQDTSDDILNYKTRIINTIYGSL